MSKAGRITVVGLLDRAQDAGEHRQVEDVLIRQGREIGRVMIK